MAQDLHPWESHLDSKSHWVAIHVCSHLEPASQAPRKESGGMEAETEGKRGSRQSRKRLYRFGEDKAGFLPSQAMTG